MNLNQLFDAASSLSFDEYAALAGGFASILGFLVALSRGLSAGMRCLVFLIVGLMSISTFSSFRKIKDDDARFAEQIRRSEQQRVLTVASDTRINNQLEVISDQGIEIENKVEEVYLDQDIVNRLQGSKIDCMSYNFWFGTSPDKKAPANVLIGDLYKKHKYAQVAIAFNTIQGPVELKLKWSTNLDSLFFQINDRTLDSWANPDGDPNSQVRFVNDICKKVTERMRFSYYLEMPLDSNRRQAMNGVELYKHIIEEDYLLWITISNLGGSDDDALNEIASDIQDNLSEGVDLSFEVDKTMGLTFSARLETEETSIQPGEVILYFSLAGKPEIFNRYKSRDMCGSD